VNGVSFETVSQRPRSTKLDITHRQLGGAQVVAVLGEVDLDTAPELYAAVTAGFERADGKPCVLDLTEVGFLGSSGLAALVNAAKHAKARREPLRIVVDSNRPVIRPIEITGLDSVLSLYHTVEEALGASETS
jgi:anti-sigma B factor antagonist